MLYSERSALIVGAGAVGAVLGARLLAAGWHVTFRVRPQSFLGYRRLGLLIHTPQGDITIPGEHFVCDAVAPGSHALVLVCTKMPDFAQALEDLHSDDDGKRIYVTAQNGLAAPEMTAALFGRERVLAGALVVNAHRCGLAEIEVQSAVRRMALAPLRPDDMPRARDVAARLREAGIDAPVAEGATALLWEKFVGLEPLATTCAVTQLTLGEVRGTPHAMVMLRGLYEEVIAVGRAAGAPLDEAMYVRRWRAFLEGPEHMRPSLAVDIASSGRHELPWLTGTVVLLGKRTHVAVPLHKRALTQLSAELASLGAADGAHNARSARAGLHAARHATLEPAQAAPRTPDEHAIDQSGSRGPSASHSVSDGARESAGASAKSNAAEHESPVRTPSSQSSVEGQHVSR